MTRSGARLINKAAPLIEDAGQLTVWELLSKLDANTTLRQLSNALSRMINYGWVDIPDNGVVRWIATKETF